MLGPSPCSRTWYTMQLWFDPADEIHELRKREKEQGLEPDWEIDAFMKASAARGKRHSIMTAYVMRMLGLEVCRISHACTDALTVKVKARLRISLDQPGAFLMRLQISVALPRYLAGKGPAPRCDAGPFSS